MVMGVPMMPSPDAPDGPEDILTPGVKSGVYHDRLGLAGYEPHVGGVPQARYAEATRKATAAAAAIDADDTVAVVTVTADGVVDRVLFVPADDIEGADTNTRKVALINGGDDGEGTTEIASIQFDNGVDATSGTPVEVTLSETAENLDVVEGDQLIWSSTAVGDGLADPGGAVYVAIDVATS